MANLPAYIKVVFVLTTFLTAWLFYKATPASKATSVLLIIWLALQAFIARTGFYTITSTVPPRLFLAVLPPLFLIMLLFILPTGRKFLDRLNPKTLTILHVIRVPVELVLFWLYVQKAVPQLMTFEGRNFDILAGLSAPLIFYFGYIKKRIGKTGLLTWNLVCLGLLVNIVANAVLSAPFPFQMFAFDQPNIAVFYDPFVWLPGCVVPLVLLSHLATIRQLLIDKNQG